MGEFVLALPLLACLGFIALAYAGRIAAARSARQELDEDAYRAVRDAFAQSIRNWVEAQPRGWVKLEETGGEVFLILPANPNAAAIEITVPRGERKALDAWPSFNLKVGALMGWSGLRVESYLADRICSAVAEGKAWDATRTGSAFMGEYRWGGIDLPGEPLTYKEPTGGDAVIRRYEPYTAPHEG